MKKISRALAILPFLITASPQLRAAEIVKANNTSGLSATTAWVGGVVPGAGDIALWDNTQTVDRVNAIGANLSFGGIKVTNPLGTSYAINSTTGFTLELGAGGIDMSNSSANLSVSANLVLNAAQTWNVGANRLLSVSGVNTGNAAVSLTGSGTLAVGSNSAFGAGSVNMAGIHLIKGGAGSRAIANAVNLLGDVSVTSAGISTQDLNFRGGLNVGSETRKISIYHAEGSFSISAITFAGGTLEAPKEITGSGTLFFENGSPNTTPMVSVKFGTFSSDSLGGYVKVRSDVRIGSNVSVVFGMAESFTADSDVTIDAGGAFNMAVGTANAFSQTIGSLSGAGLVSKDSLSTAAHVATLTIDGGVRSSTFTFSGTIQDGTGTGRVGVTKTGNTTQVFAGISTYIGQTKVSAGSLLINGVHSAASSSLGGFGSATDGRFLVESGASLGGSGRVNVALAVNTNANNAIYVKAGGMVAPGSQGIGTFVLDAAGFSRSGGNDVFLNMAADARFALDLSGDGTSADKIAFWSYVAGDLKLNGNAINFSLSGPLVEGTYTARIFEFFSDSGITAVNSDLLAGLTIGTVDPNIVGSPTLNFHSGGSYIDVTYTVIPEPSSLLLMVAGAIFFGWKLRMRRQNKNA